MHANKDPYSIEAILLGQWGGDRSKGPRVRINGRDVNLSLVPTDTDKFSLLFKKNLSLFGPFAMYPEDRQHSKKA